MYIRIYIYICQNECFWWGSLEVSNYVVFYILAAESKDRLTGLQGGAERDLLGQRSQQSVEGASCGKPAINYPQ